MTLQVLLLVSGILSRSVLVCLGFLERISPALDLTLLNQISFPAVTATSDCSMSGKWEVKVVPWQ